MSKITITRNCANGEHVFIVAQSYVEGRETMHTAFVCQHCLYYVSSSEWDAHIRINFEKSEKDTNAICNTVMNSDSENQNPKTDNMGTTYYLTEEQKKYSIKEETKLPYPGKKRGPKPKGKINGL